MVKIGKIFLRPFVKTQPVITCSKLTIETREQGMFKVNNKGTRTTSLRCLYG